MSLITRPTHKVTVTPLKLGKDKSGALAYEKQEPVVVLCNVRAQSSEGANRSSSSATVEHGVLPEDTYILTVPPGVWPATLYAYIEWEDPYSGQTLKGVQKAHAAKFRGSAATAHDRVIMTIGQGYGSP